MICRFNELHLADVILGSWNHVLMVPCIARRGGRIVGRPIAQLEVVRTAACHDNRDAPLIVRRAALAKIRRVPEPR